jgi:DNA-binding transcriptional regulator YiaG
MKTTKAISYITAALVLFLAVGAFVLSYDALKALALDNGVTPGLTWLWPLLVDGAIIIFSLAVLRGSLLGERVRYPWALVILFVALSIGFNIVHAQNTLLARVIAAVPPVALALSFELFTGQLKAEVTRRGVVTTLSELEEMTDQRRSELDDLVTQIEGATARVNALDEQIDMLKSERRETKRVISRANERSQKRPDEQSNDERMVNLDHANLSRKAAMELRREQLAQIVDADLSQAELAERFGVSVSTIRRDLQAITDVSDNGRVS